MRIPQTRPGAMQQVRRANDLFTQQSVELTGIAAARLTDGDTLAALAVAAAGAVGIPTNGAPTVRRSPQGLVVAALSHDGHIVLHTAPERGVCFVDIVARGVADAGRGIEVVARRLGAAPGASPPPTR